MRVKLALGRKKTKKAKSKAATIIVLINYNKTMEKISDFEILKELSEAASLEPLVFAPETRAEILQEWKILEKAFSRVPAKTNRGTFEFINKTH